MNDNRKPMSPIGSAIFAMCADMGHAQARIYSQHGANPHAEALVLDETIRLQQLHQPLIISAIKRQGDA